MEFELGGRMEGMKRMYLVVLVVAVLILLVAFFISRLPGKKQGFPMESPPMTIDGDI